MKNRIIGLYVIACLIMMCAEPPTEPIMLLVGYYAFVIANMANAVRLLNKKSFRYE